jgi:hypothetical protein
MGKATHQSQQCSGQHELPSHSLQPANFVAWQAIESSNGPTPKEDHPKACTAQHHHPDSERHTTVPTHGKI